MVLSSLLYSFHSPHSDDPGSTPVQRLLQQKKTAQIASVPLKLWDKGVFSMEMMRQRLVPQTDPAYAGTLPSDRTEPLPEGTYGGTQLAITEFYDRMERAFSSAFEALGIEKVIPQRTGLDEKKKIFQWAGGKPGNRYPPHLRSVEDNPIEDVLSTFTIFNKLGLIGTQLILDMIVPKTFLQDIREDVVGGLVDVAFGDPYRGPTIADCERYNNSRHQTGTDIMRGQNIGNEPDWYSDARFGQQQIAGVNPTSLKLASDAWISGFTGQAKAQGLQDMVHLLSSANRKALYVQDCHYFRDAIRVDSDDLKAMQTHDDWGSRYGCAAVSLFQLQNDGRLHPLAIIIDWRGEWDTSVTIFNKRLSPDDSTSREKDDWPWRYAKTCAQVSDWAVHEVTAHLTDTHMIEEATIVATQRTIPENHIIFKLLDPHWFRTLSLNAAARKTLVPSVVSKLLGIDTEKSYEFIKYGYNNFNWTEHYVPNDLERRGFPPAELEHEKFRNCAYAKDASLMWAVLRHFVKSMLDLAYASDADVENDKYVKDWYEEIRSDDGGQIKTFPIIHTVDELADAVTMCIHIAAPQHTAVNYLQNYYQAFVIARPPALCMPLPESLEQLKGYTEKDLTAALPIGEKHSKMWLLAAQLPHLLSYKVADEYNIMNFALSLYNLYKRKSGKDEDGIDEDRVRTIAEELYGNLWNLEGKFTEYSNHMTKGTVPYTVMNPMTTAVSILI